MVSDLANMFDLPGENMLDKNTFTLPSHKII